MTNEKLSPVDQMKMNIATIGDTRSFLSKRMGRITIGDYLKALYAAGFPEVVSKVLVYAEYDYGHAFTTVQTATVLALYMSFLDSDTKPLLITEGAYSEGTEKHDETFQHGMAMLEVLLMGEGLKIALTSGGTGNAEGHYKQIQALSGCKTVHDLGYWLVNERGCINTDASVQLAPTPTIH